MKKLALAALAAAVLPHAFAQYKPDEARLSVIPAIKADTPKVQDALWTAPERLKVGVVNDGSKRDGLATYVCGFLEERGFKGMRVTVDVIDIALVAREGKWRTLGSARCA